MAVARLFPAFLSSESACPSKGSSPGPSSPGSSGLLSLSRVGSVQWDLKILVKSSSRWCSGNRIKCGERCWLEATSVLVPLWVWIGIELCAREFLDVLGGMFDYFQELRVEIRIYCHSPKFYKGTLVMWFGDSEEFGVRVKTSLDEEAKVIGFNFMSCALLASLHFNLSGGVRFWSVNGSLSWSLELPR